MKIKYENWRGVRELEVHQYIKAAIEGRVYADFAHGEVCAEALGRLVEVLANKGVLDEDEVRHVATGEALPAPAQITTAMVRALRDKTNASLTSCRLALVETNGDEEEAERLIRG